MREQSTSPILNTSLFVRHHAGTLHKSNLEQILVFKAPHGTIHESNREHLLVFKAQCGDNPWVQSWTLPCLKGTTWGRYTSPIQNNSLLLRLHVGTIHEYNLDNLLVFKAPGADNPRVQSGTPPCFLGSMWGQSICPIVNTFSDGGWGNWLCDLRANGRPQN